MGEAGWHLCGLLSGEVLRIRGCERHEAVDAIIDVLLEPTLLISQQMSLRLRFFRLSSETLSEAVCHAGTRGTPHSRAWCSSAQSSRPRKPETRSLRSQLRS